MRKRPKHRASIRQTLQIITTFLNIWFALLCFDFLNLHISGFYKCDLLIEASTKKVFKPSGGS